MKKNYIKIYFDKIFWNLYATAYDDISKYYNAYKLLMREIIGFIAKNIKTGSKILDAGCGTGALSIGLAAIRYKIFAVDISNSMLDIFRHKIRKLNYKNFNISNADLNRKLKFGKNIFDCVINVHSLFMMNDIFFTLRQFDNILKPGGLIIIAHPKPIKFISSANAIIKDEGLFKGMISIFRLLRVAFFNMFLRQIHKRVYGVIPADKIIKFYKNKKYRLIFKKDAYYGTDTLIAMKKPVKKQIHLWSARRKNG